MQLITEIYVQFHIYKTEKEVFRIFFWILIKIWQIFDIWICDYKLEYFHVHCLKHWQIFNFLHLFGHLILEEGLWKITTWVLIYFLIGIKLKADDLVMIEKTIYNTRHSMLQKCSIEIPRTFREFQDVTTLEVNFHALAFFTLFSRKCAALPILGKYVHYLQSK